MNKAFRILLAVLLVQLSLQASAQEKKDLFNPVNYAVVSQTKIGRASCRERV